MSYRETPYKMLSATVLYTQSGNVWLPIDLENKINEYTTKLGFEGSNLVFGDGGPCL